MQQLQIDRSAPTQLTDFSWQMGLGNDHAYQLHRNDVCEHIKLAHDELGIQFIRCHGIFDDDMLTYQRMSDYRAFRSVPMRTNAPVEYAAFVEGEKTQVLIYAQDQDYFKNEKHDIVIEVNCAATFANVQRIDDTHCNPKAVWVSMGSPDYLSKAQVQQIKQATCLKAEPVDFAVSDGKTRISLSMQTNDVVLLTIG